MFDFTIALNPVAASRPRIGTWGAYYEGSYRDFKKSAIPLMERAFEGARPVIPAGPLDVSIHMYVTRPKSTKLDYPKGDVDNFAKAVLDASNGFAWGDDSQIVDLHAYKRWAKKDVPGWFTVRVDRHVLDDEEKQYD